MATDKPRKYEKLVEMWFQAFFYSFVITLIFTLLGIQEGWGTFDIIQCILPVTFGKFWYFTAFFGLFFAAPILNRFIFTIDEDTAKRALLLFIALFSMMGILGDPFEANGGYSTIWLIALYCIGALAKKIRLFESRKTVTLILLWAVCLFVTWAVYVFFDFVRIVNYVSPTVLLSGMIMVVLFSRLPVKGTVVTKLSPLVFGVYLLQLNQVVWNNILGNACASAASENIAVGVLHVVAFASAIFVSGLAIEFARSRAAKLLRIPLLSKKIVLLADKLLVKASAFLK